MGDSEGVADIVLGDEPSRSVPCECCDGEGVVTICGTPARSVLDERVCQACGGWGWREP